MLLRAAEFAGADTALTRLRDTLQAKVSIAPAELRQRRTSATAKLLTRALDSIG